MIQIFLWTVISTKLWKSHSDFTRLCPCPKSPTDIFVFHYFCMFYIFMTYSISFFHLNWIVDAWSVFPDTLEALQDNTCIGGYGILQNKENCEVGARLCALFNFGCRSDCMDLLSFICTIVIIISAHWMQNQQLIFDTNMFFSQMSNRWRDHGPVPVQSQQDSSFCPFPSTQVPLHSICVLPVQCEALH